MNGCRRNWFAATVAATAKILDERTVNCSLGYIIKFSYGITALKLLGVDLCREMHFAAHGEKILLFHSLNYQSLIIFFV